MTMWTGTSNDIWLANNQNYTAGSSLSAWYQAMQTTNAGSGRVQPAEKKKPETALAWLREQVEEVTQLAA